MPIPKWSLQIIEEKDPTTKSIDLSNQGLFDHELDPLITALNMNPFILHLDLHRNNLSNGSYEKLAQLKYIHILNLDSNDFSSEGITPLIMNTAINILNLSCNNLSDEVATLIGNYAAQENINVSGNRKLSHEALEVIRNKLKLNREKSKKDKPPEQVIKKVKVDEKSAQQLDKLQTTFFTSSTPQVSKLENPLTLIDSLKKLIHEQKINPQEERLHQMEIIVHQLKQILSKQVDDTRYIVTRSNTMD